VNDALGYAGRRVVVSGAASGMGEATARILVELGAEVHALDIRDPSVEGLASFTRCDLREPAEIDAAAARIGRVVNALFNCAGLPNSFPPIDVMLVNFCGTRHLTEAFVPLMIEGSAIVSIASNASIGWESNLALLSGLLDTPGFDEARAWCDAHPAEMANAYGLSKQAVNAYTARRSFALAREGIRINCTNPGPTDTPMMPEFEKAVGKAYMDRFPVPLGRHAVAAEQAWPVVFLNSPRAAFVSGASVDVDGGFRAGLVTGQIDVTVLMPEGVAAANDQG